MGTALGDRIRRELAADQGRRDDLLEWFNQYKDTLGVSEKRDIEAAFGLTMPLEERSFTDLVPDTTWFSELMSLTEDFESPSAFAFLAGLVVFGQLVGSKVTIKRGGSSLWTSVSALLTSPAGEGRRSTISDFVVYNIGVPAGLKVISDSFTYEAMGDYLMELPSPEALLYAGELSTLIGKGSYGESIIPKLTDMIGKTSSFQWTTVKRGKITFNKPCVNALWTSAPDWLAENIPSVAFGGGTWSRFLMGVAERREKFVTWSEPVGESRIKQVIQSLKALTGGIKGEFKKPEGEAWEWYHEWYQRHSKKLAYGDIPDPRMAPYASRKHDHLLRVTALLTLAAAEETVFRVERFEQALDILDWLEASLPRAYSSMALSPFATAQKAVVERLERAGGSLDHSRLHRRLHRILPLAAHFKEVMKSLKDMGVVQEVKSVSGRGTTYILRRKLDG